jgi:radical S-adenosyl methionine domain-containing protein 2
MRTKITTVNYHLVKSCQMSCNFCYARFDDVIRDTKVSALGLNTEQAKKIILELTQLGFRKINFAGGEPILRKDLPELIKYAKSLGLTTSLVTNGHLISQDWLKRVTGILDQIGISVDSSNPDTRIKMGRAINNTPLTNEDYISRAKMITASGIALKINTVVTAQNHLEDMTQFILDLKPRRWKVFQALQIDNQNNLDESKILCQDEWFADYRLRHSSVLTHGIIAIFEDNEDMQSSYAMVDPAGRFYDNTEGKHTYSDPILSVGGATALGQTSTSFEKFLSRGGVYQI